MHVAKRLPLNWLHCAAPEVPTLFCMTKAPTRSSPGLCFLGGVLSCLCHRQEDCSRGRHQMGFLFGSDRLLVCSYP